MKSYSSRAQELCEILQQQSSGAVWNLTAAELRSCVKSYSSRAQELCEQGSGPGLSVIPYPIPHPHPPTPPHTPTPTSLISHTVLVDVKKLRTSELRSCVNRDVGLGSHSLSQSSSVPNKPYGFGGRKASWKKKKMPMSELRSCVNREVVGLGFSFPTPPTPFFPRP